MTRKSKRWGYTKEHARLWKEQLRS